LNFRCVEDGSYAYSGQTCEVRTEKLTLESGAIIGIAVGSGGFIFAVLVCVIVCLVIRNRKIKKDVFSHR